ncbi:dual specificity protein phosphatase CDC14A-like isoform X1 [Nasonia vitripennis]|uniref:protein-tyrosine-phosphatase n=1 Tax=Nasonia vitripennis TaxID=7425 RepID=A0A7M7QZU1_NASVI|nr:dual specificity protein phosphatase CDC14A-like isoform X1 [Nasonia vitripennis]XP_032455249.1 dual specificity protein phosphatase CDC14A-like isoform X1 [Nasonia vitripennis]
MSGQSPKSSSRFSDYHNPVYSQQNSNTSISIFAHPDLTAVSELIKNKFYFATLAPGKRVPKTAPNVYLFDVDEELVYNNFYSDFGPLNIACLHNIGLLHIIRYCHGVNQILNNPDYKLDKIVHFASANAEKRANAAYLAASYSVLYLDKSPDEAYDLIASKGSPPLKPFRDVSIGVAHYTIDLIDCLNALSKASSLGFFNLEDFDAREYEKYEQIKNGDLNWIVPRKFLAFLGPNTEQGTTSHYPEKYLNYFMKNEVAAVVRLNRKTYESFRFTNAGILHYDIFFPDGTVPPKKVLKQFLHIAESTRGAIAVHCKAGLGRTGTLIAAYVMKHYRMTAREAIAWLRICRPGSIIGHQQSWLEEMESSLWREGRRYRMKYHGDENLILHHKRGVYSVAAKFDRKVRFREYLSKETLNRTKSEKLKLQKERIERPANLNLRCSSARESSGIGTPKPQNTVDEGENSRAMTQGDKLNEIKMRRTRANNVEQLFDPRIPFVRQNFR